MIVFFPGPDKTATTWFYRQFLLHPQIKVIGGKEDLAYLNFLSKEKKENSLIKLYAIFDHEAPFRGLEVTNLMKKNKLHCIIIFRDPLQRTISAIKNDIRMGVLNHDDALKIIKNKNNKYFKRSDYGLYINLCLETKSDFSLIDINDIKNNEEKLIKKISKKFNLDSKYFQKNLVINQARSVRSVKLNLFIKKFIKPIFYKIKLGKLWHNMYHSFLSQVFFKNNDQIINFSIDKKTENVLKKNYEEIKIKYMDKFI